MNTELSPFSISYAAYYKQKPIAFMAILHCKFFAHYYRVSRLVVLPDYQGIGIGKRFLTFMAEKYTVNSSRPFIIVTSNPQLIRSQMTSNWQITRVGHAGKMRLDMLDAPYNATSRGRLTISIRYFPSKPQIQKQKLPCQAPISHGSPAKHDETLQNPETPLSHSQQEK